MAGSHDAAAVTSDYLEGLLEGFVAYDGDWRMTYMNAAAERLLNRQRSDVLGKRWHEAFPHAVGNPVDRMYQRVMKTRAGESMEYFYAHYGRWMEISASPVRTGGVGVYFRDIHERKAAEDRLREADRRKDEFLATLAHELRNPLAPIHSALQLLRIADKDEEVARQARQIMERQIGHLVRLVDDLMEVSRISRGKIELQKEPTDLAEVIGSAVETSRPLIEGARHRLRIELPREALQVHADSVRLAQVLANLLNNAAKYTPEGGDIVLSVSREGGQALVSVRDNGLGLTPELLEKVFDMFAQGLPQRTQGGLGIGLALARMLVQMHGGSIEARSAGPGQGSEFLVRLPALEARLPLPAQPPEPWTLRGKGPRRILVVDDNLDAANSLGLLLRQHGHDVHIAHDGAAGLEAARARAPDMILLDISMPGLDGLGVARRLRADPRLGPVPIIAITGLGQDEDRRRTREAGFDEHLVKPVSPERLRDVLERF